MRGVVGAEALGLRILRALCLHKRWIEVTLHGISTAATAAATHSHTYSEYIQEGLRKKNSARAKRDH